ncbi:MAG TPA: hypothetical protein PLQ93_07930 [Bacteroidia bacterium]|nr:hypothetical protein [Bacteroidia bacterium]
MSQRSEILFEEKQFLGHNPKGIVIRSLLTLFCFMAYFWSENPNPVQVSFISIGSYPIRAINYSGLVFFILGVSIMLFSTVLVFVKHTHVRVYTDHLIIEGFWTSRMVKIDIRDLTRLRRSRYKRNGLRRAVYNLHNLSIIRFHTKGEEFVELTDQKGFVYRIGSQRSRELHKIIEQQMQFKAAL